MYLDSLANRVTNFPNVGNPRGSGDRVDPFQVFRIHRVFNKSKGIYNGIKGLEGRKNFIIFNNMRNPISGPIDKQKLHIGDNIITGKFNPGFFTSSLKIPEALMLAIAIIFKKFQKMRILFF